MKKWRAVYYIGVLAITGAYFGLLFKTNLISADIFIGKESFNKKVFEAVLDGKTQKLEIESYKEEGRFVHKLYLKKGINKRTEMNLSGFDEDIFLCQEKVISLGGDQGQALCFVGNVGVHSRNIQLVKIQSGEMSEVSISEGTNKTPNIYSDMPNFLFEDYNTDGLIDFIVDYRNYEKDSVDAIRNYFRGTISGFVFDRNENIVYDISG